MTRNRRSKRATQSRMARTGEKYTEARRALLASGGDSGRAGEDPAVTIARPEDSLGWFTDQAYNAILLAEDEARVLSRATVDPEHLLLAATRYRNVERLLDGEAFAARAIHDAILRIKGFGQKLELRPQRSPASEGVLRRAVAVAADRGILAPSTEHLLLALGEHELPAHILTELGITDVQALVDATYPVTQPPIEAPGPKRKPTRTVGRVPVRNENATLFGVRPAAAQRLLAFLCESLERGRAFPRGFWFWATAAARRCVCRLLLR